jgi:hypothetical protein
MAEARSRPRRPAAPAAASHASVVAAALAGLLAVGFGARGLLLLGALAYALAAWAQRGIPHGGDPGR